MRTDDVEGQVHLFDRDMFAGKTFREPSQAEHPKGKTFGLSSKRSFGLSAIIYQSLDLTPGNGNLLGEFYWEQISPWLGGSSMLNTGESPKDGVGSFLSQILEEAPHRKYYLSRKACLGILRRASERGKKLPPQLEVALRIQAGLMIETDHTTTTLKTSEGKTNGKGECLTPWDTQQARVFSPEGKAPTLTSNTERASPVLCLNDQGGERMDVETEKTGTLRASMQGHPPLVLPRQSPEVFENHAVDARYTGPLTVAPTLSARCGTGGNNLPLVEQSETSTYCIVGNVIDRKPENGGNGMGCQEELAYTLTGTDRHAVFSRQRVDTFKDGTIASTESARQYKDATDLVCDPKMFGQSQFGAYAEGCATLRAQGGDMGGGSENLVVDVHLIRRLTPLECERLQGFPDGWTDLPGASDAARYKALGNSVAIPCVEYVMRGIAMALLGLDAEDKMGVQSEMKKEEVT